MDKKLRHQATEWYVYFVPTDDVHEREYTYLADGEEGYIKTTGDAADVCGFRNQEQAIAVATDLGGYVTDNRIW